MSYLFGPVWLNTAKGFRCAHSPLLTEIRRGLVLSLRGVAHAVYMFEKITECSLLQHLSIYCNDNHSLSNLYCPFVVHTIPKIFCSQAQHQLFNTVSSPCIAHNKPIANSCTPLHLFYQVQWHPFLVLLNLTGQTPLWALPETSHYSSHVHYSDCNFYTTGPIAFSAVKLMQQYPGGLSARYNGSRIPQLSALLYTPWALCSAPHAAFSDPSRLATIHSSQQYLWTSVFQTSFCI